MTTNNETTEAATNNGNAIEKTAKTSAGMVLAWMQNDVMQRQLSAALSGYMDVGTFAAQCFIAAQDPKIAACSPMSLFKAFLECAQMGLLPGAHHKHVALVPRGGVVTVTPQWQGYKFLMERQAGIKRVRPPILVHKVDKFSGLNGDITHEYNPFDPARVFEHPADAKAAKPSRECGLIGGYLRVEYDDGTIEMHTVTAAKIHKNRECAKTQDIWQRWFEEMCMKTVVRDAWAKRIVSIDPQLASRVAKVDAIDNALIGNDPMRARSLGSGEELPNMAALNEGETAPVTPATGSGRAAIGLPVETAASDAS